MITIFTIPKKFEGHIGIIQTNAILSWKNISNVQIILFGNEFGVSDFAKSHELMHIPIISTTKFDTPLVSDAFNLAKTNSSYNVLAYVNCDIIFTDDIMKNINFIAQNFPKWLIVGRRIDMNISELINYSNLTLNDLRIRAKAEGELHSVSGIDYFIFPKNTELDMPDLVVGRPSWDNWLIFKFRSLKIPIIDVTKTNLVIHQNHPRFYKVFGPESLSNFNLAGGTFNLCSIRHSTHQTLFQNGNFVIKKYRIGIIRFNPIFRFLNSIKLDLVNIYLEKIKKV